jgi:DNA invertase Pin-like site-specific DNA recombinase
MEQETAIIIYSIDRLGRNVYQTSRVCEKVELKKSYIISVTEQTCFGINRLTDQLFFQKLIEAEMFSNMLSERAKSRIKLLKENGEYIGKAPWGKMCIKDVENKRILVDNPPEQEIITKLKVFLIKENKSFYEVHRYLISENILNQFWPLCKLKNIIKKYFTNEEKLKINYIRPEIFNETNKKRINIKEDEIEEIDNSFKKRVQIN